MKTRETKLGDPLGWIRSWIFLRGEQVVVAAGAWLAVLVVLIVVSGGMWTLWVQRETARLGNQERLIQTVELLAKAIEPLAERDQIANVQSLASEIATRAGLEGLTVRLAEGPVIADKASANLNNVKLPKTWGRASKDLVRFSRDASGMTTARGVCEVVGRGDILVEISASDRYSLLAQRESLMGVGVVSVGALVGGLLVYRLLRARLRALGAIQESLRFAVQFEQGELPTTGLRLADDLGDEARAWNRLLSERDHLKQRDKLERAAERLKSRGAASGEYGAAFDAVWLGLVVLDEQCKIRAINGAAAAMLSIQKQEAIDKLLSTVVPFQEVNAAAAMIVGGQQRQRANFEVAMESGAASEKTILRVNLRPMRREDGCAAILVLEDITQQRVANDSRNAFVASATHELRTPLTSMRLHLEQLAESGDGDPLVKARCMNVLTSETRRLERIVGDMLSLSEMDAGTFSLRVDDVDAQELFKDLELDYQATAADKEITLKFELPPKWPTVRADRDKVGMALHNLVSNALKYTPVGGRVTVRITDNQGGLMVEVADNGIGISPEEQELVFEKFYRSKDKRVASITGSGIGLALAREVIRLHGGDIRLESHLDKGSTFILTLPPVTATSGSSRMAA